jgi:diphosphomevalonate decarboxylase
MPTWKATACSCSNIAFIKYWGNRDNKLRIPASGSISMNLGGLFTCTSVEFRPASSEDTITVDGIKLSGVALERVSHHLNHVRKLAGFSLCAEVISTNNFPSGAGIASSASAFAALSVASAAAADLRLSERELSALARLGSGSASRSIPGGFVEWYPGESHETSYAESIAPADHWALTDVIAIVSAAHKATGSTEGHALAGASPLQDARIQSAPGRITTCRDAILNRDFDELAAVVELDSNMMHAVMMTSHPALFYWQPGTLLVMDLVRRLRGRGIGVCYTIDAGPNVHCICAPGEAQAVKEALASIAEVREIREAPPGGSAYVEQPTGPDNRSGATP